MQRHNSAYTSLHDFTSKDIEVLGMYSGKSKPLNFGKSTKE